MVINIKDTDYEVKFGIGFVRELDKKYFINNANGTPFGVGLETRLPLILINDPIALSEFLYTGTCTEKKRPSQIDVDDYIDNVEDIEALFTEVIDELKKQNATKMRIAEAEENLKKNLKMAEKEG